MLYTNVTLSGEVELTKAVIVNASRGFTLMSTKDVNRLHAFPACSGVLNIPCGYGSRIPAVKRKVPLLSVDGICIGTQYIWTTDTSLHGDSFLSADILHLLKFDLNQYETLPVFGRRVFTRVDSSTWSCALYQYLESIHRTDKYHELLGKLVPEDVISYDEFVSMIEKEV